MFKKILFISDNIYLCKRLKPIIEPLIGKISVNFSTSPFSDSKAFSEELKEPVFIYNLKDIDDINLILERYDLIISIHCKQIFPNTLIDNLKCINIHPGYNPINRGWYPQVFSINYDLPVGATIHEIDYELDNGPIIAREFVTKQMFDTSETLYNKILDKEIELFEKHINSIVSNEYTTVVPENRGNLFLKKDFNKLCEIDLNENLKMSQCIDRLRALTHGQLKNAYFIDNETNQKVYVSINFSR